MIRMYIQLPIIPRDRIKHLQRFQSKSNFPAFYVITWFFGLYASCNKDNQDAGTAVFYSTNRCLKRIPRAGGIGQWFRYVTLPRYFALHIVEQPSPYIIRSGHAWVLDIYVGDQRVHVSVALRLSFEYKYILDPFSNLSFLRPLRSYLALSNSPLAIYIYIPTS